MMTALEQEMSDYQGLVKSIIFKYYNKSLYYNEFDDLFIIGLEGLQRGVETYSTDYTKINHYTMCIRNKISSYLQNEYDKAQRRKEAGFQSCALEEYHHNVGGCSDFDVVEVKMTIDRLLHSNILTQREKRILNLSYRGLTQQDIAEITKLSQSTVNRELKGLKRKLKQIM